MSKFKIKWNSEKMVSLSAMSISFITLLIFIYQTNIMRKQNDLSIMPYLDLSITNDVGSHTFELNLKNHGVGPAIIESVTMEYQNKKYNLVDFDNSLFQFIKTKNQALDSIQMVSTSTLDVGMAIPVNASYNVFRVSGSRKDFQLITTELNIMLEKGLKYEVVYKSIQGDRWKIYHNSEGPERL